VQNRRVGVFMITSMAAILAITGGAYVALRSNNQASDPVATALSGATVSRATKVLMSARQQMIQLDAASATLNVESSPKLSVQPVAAPSSPAGGTVADEQNPAPPPDPGTAQSIAYKMLPSFGFSPSTQYSCLNNIWTRESGWRYNAENASGAYGIPQALPGSKMASAGPDWETNPATQIKWGLGYIRDSYGSPCSALSFKASHNWY